MACEKIKTEKVICDEIFYLEDTEDVNIGFDVPTGSDIAGNVQVTLHNCEVFIPDGVDVIRADLLFMVQKELTITTNAGDEFPLEYAERLPFTVDFAKCIPSNLERIGIGTDNLKCQIVSVVGDDNINLNTGNNTFQEILDIRIKIKVVKEVQEIVQLCPANQQTLIEIDDL